MWGFWDLVPKLRLNSKKMALASTLGTFGCVTVSLLSNDPHVESDLDDCSQLQLFTLKKRVPYLKKEDVRLIETDETTI